MIVRFIAVIALSLGLGGCAVTAVVGAAASVVGAGVDVAGSAVSATIDVVGAGVSGAIDLATSDDDDDDGKEKPAAPVDPAAKQVIAGAELEKPAKDPASETNPAPEADDGSVETVMEFSD